MPDFRPAESQLERQTDRLHSLIGDEIAGAWAVWNLEHDEWFADLPVVLQMKRGAQLEVCWEKLDDLSIAWHTIDLTVPPTAWVEWPLEWRRNALPELQAIPGAVVMELAASRFRFVTEAVDHPASHREVWLTAGLWIRTIDAGLHVFNALDENGVSSRPPLRDADNDWRPL